MTLKFIFTLIFLASFSSITSIKLKCTFSHSGWDNSVPKVYKCEAQSVNITSRVMITEAVGQHVSTEKNINVNAFRIHNQICELFPSGIEKFFNHLEAIAIQKCKLKIVTKSDLAKFENLKSLSLHGNELTTLEFNLFAFNKNLKLVSLYDNKLTHIAEDIFDNLPHITSAYFNDNVCINSYSNDESDLKILKEILKLNCSSTIEMKNYHDLEMKYENIDKNYNDLKKKIQYNANEIEMLKNLNENLKNKNACSKDEVVKIEEEKCDGKLKNFMSLLDKIDLVCDFHDENTCMVNDAMILYQHLEIVSVKYKNNSNLAEFAFDFVNLNPLSIENLMIKNLILIQLPKNIGTFFKALKNLTITQTELTSLCEISLVNLNNLKMLKFWIYQIMKFMHLIV